MAREREFHWIGTSLKDLRAMPVEIRKAFGAALRFAELGELPHGCRAFGEGLPRDILKLAHDHGGDTYRAAFLLAKECVYLLHVFKKKPSSGKATPRPEKQTIVIRWKAARNDYQKRYRHER